VIVINQKNNKKDPPKLPALPRRHLTLGERAAYKVTVFCGTWKFIFILFLIILVWIYLNILAWTYRWDPYPFILLNLSLSCIAAIQAPIILMSQNLEAERDRKRAEYDYIINRKAEREVANMQQDLDEIKALIRSLKK